MGRWLSLSLLLPALAACGGPKDQASDFEVGNGTLNLFIADAPVDDARQVVISVVGVELRPVGAAAIQLDFNPPLRIELLATAGGIPAPLAMDVSVPAGPYQSLRLLLLADPETLDSFIELEDGTLRPLSVPADAQRDLRIDDFFTISSDADEPSTIVVDIDLRRSLINLPGTDDYVLRPVLRTINPDETGGFFGFISAARASAPGCTMDLGTGAGGAVYVFEGRAALADDVDGIGAQPVATARVMPSTNPNRVNEFEYSVSYLEEGRYSAFFTCQARLDDPLTDEIITFTGLNRPVSVFRDQSIQFDFVP